MRRHFSSISSILLGVSIWCLNFAFTHAAVENEPSTEEVTTQAITTNDECLGHTQYCKVGTSDMSTWVSSFSENCFCCQGQAKIYSYIQFGYYLQSCRACAVGTYMSLIAHYSPSPNCNSYSCTLNYNCYNCQAGKYQNSEGQSTCKSCAAGKFSLWSGGASVCTDCAAGKLSAAGALLCAPCPAGQ